MAEYPPELDLNRLKKEMNLSDKAIAASGFTESELQSIYKDYLDRLDPLYDLKNRFVSEHIVSAKNLQLHSFSARIKEPDHLIEKIIRKRSTNDLKYRSMTTSDYYKYITDLIGCRILLVYKHDWEKVHDYLVGVFPDDPSLYIDENQYALSYDVAPSIAFMAEPPVAHMRLGDPEIYPPSMQIERDRYYRSLHYIIRYEEYYIELQVRTLFEEAWGEVDHDVLYKDNPYLVDFSKLINRISGAGDAMSSYFKLKLFPLIPPTSSDTLIDVPITTTTFPLTPPPPPPLSTPVTPPISAVKETDASGEDILNSIIFRKGE